MPPHSPVFSYPDLTKVHLKKESGYSSQKLVTAQVFAAVRNLNSQDCLKFPYPKNLPVINA